MGSAKSDRLSMTWCNYCGDAANCQYPSQTLLKSFRINCRRERTSRMANYYRWTKHPKDKEFQVALWMDDYFGPHRYGIQFINNEKEVKYNTIYHEIEFDPKSDLGEFCDRRGNTNLDKGQ